MNHKYIKKSIRLFILIFIGTLLIGICFTYVSEKINERNIIKNKNNNIKQFGVHFDKTKKPTINNNLGSISIDNKDDKIAYASITGLKNKGDKAIAKYVVVNDESKENNNSNIGINLTNSNGEYFKATSKIDNIELKTKGRTTIDIIVELIKDSNEPVSTIIQATLSPIEIK